MKKTSAINSIGSDWYCCANYNTVDPDSSLTKVHEDMNLLVKYKISVNGDVRVAVDHVLVQVVNVFIHLVHGGNGVNYDVTLASDDVLDH